MATVASRARGWRVRPKYALFGLIGLMLAYVLYHNEAFLIDPRSPDWAHLRQVGPLLVPHGVIGAIALACGFTQFSSRLRSARPAVHRLLGRIYVTAVFLVAPLGAYIQYSEEALGESRSFSLAALTFAFLWVFATAMAFWHIRSRRIEDHRQWMTRSFAMAMVFFEVRVIGGLTGWDDTPATDEIVVWTCVALGYPVADTVLQIERWLQSRKRAAA
jgi:uncharacterized membrane protein